MTPRGYHTHRRPFGERISCRNDRPCAICVRRQLTADVAVVLVVVVALVVVSWWTTP